MIDPSDIPRMPYGQMRDQDLRNHSIHTQLMEYSAVLAANHAGSYHTADNQTPAEEKKIETMKKFTPI